MDDVLQQAVEEQHQLQTTQHNEFHSFLVDFHLIHLKTNQIALNFVIVFTDALREIVCIVI